MGRRSEPLRHYKNKEKPKRRKVASTTSEWVGVEREVITAFDFV